MSLSILSYSLTVVEQENKRMFHQFYKYSSLFFLSSNLRLTRSSLSFHLSLTSGKCAVIKTSTRQTYFLPVIGLVEVDKLKPGDLVGVNKDSYLILETLPSEYDSRVKAMEVDERPTEQYSDIGGLDKQIQELIEAVVLPVTHKER